MSHTHDDNCKCKSNVAAQSLDEMDFERGIWSAALYNDLKKLDKFIALGQTNMVDSAGYTSLHYAARNGHMRACEKLLDAHAEVNTCTRSGGVSPLARASLMGHANVVELLLRNGADSFQQDNDGNTALHKAVQNNHQNVIKLLLEFSKDANRLEEICNKNGLKAGEINNTQR